MIMGTVAVFAVLGLVDADDRARTPEDHDPLGRGVRSMSAAGVARPSSTDVTARASRSASGRSLVYAFLFLPILVIVVYSFNNGRTMLTWGGSD